MFLIMSLLGKRRLRLNHEQLFLRREIELSIVISGWRGNKSYKKKRFIGTDMAY